LLASEVSSTHVPLQSCCVPGHAHVPFWHVWPPEHGFAQCPQFIGSLVMFASQPSDVTWLQSWYGELHVTMVHAPFMHPLTAFASAHAFVHDPQCCVSLPVLISQPSLAVLLQSV
jgi:hypothetical protein